MAGDIASTCVLPFEVTLTSVASSPCSHLLGLWGGMTGRKHGGEFPCLKNFLPCEVTLPRASFPTRSFCDGSAGVAGYGGESLN